MSAKPPKPPKSDVIGRLRWERRQLRNVVAQMADSRFWCEYDPDQIQRWLRATLEATKNEPDDIASETHVG